MLTTLWNRLLDQIFPQKCIICREISSNLICESCSTKAFEYYGESSELSLPIEYLSLFKYNAQLKTLIEELKFKKNLAVLPIIEKQILKYFSNYKNYDLIIPVPLNPERLKERGFNQAEIMIKNIAYFHKIPLKTDLVFRQYNTRKSYNLNPLERNAQAEKAFAVWPNKALEIKGKNILVFDDIITTGSTVTEIAKLLKPYGPRTIQALIFSRPIRQ